MQKNSLRIVCFGSGDFPIETFEFLAKNYNVVGIVTSNDKPVFGNKRVYDIAVDNDIPVCIPKDLESEDFLDWLDNVDGNVYCVISYKFLPKCVVEKAKFSFNIHASELPFLKGAAPINWAIRYGFERTGLTAITLADKIDEGYVMFSGNIPIEESDNFGTLFKKLSHYSVTVVDDLLLNYLDDDIEYRQQPYYPKSMDSKLFHAPKLTKENTSLSYYDDELETPDARGIHNFIRSLSPNIGATFKLTIKKWINEDGEFSDVKDITFKVYESELINKSKQWINDNYTGSDIITDWKTYLYLISLCDEDYVISLKKIQIPGKKILDVKEFLKGFQVYNKPEYSFFLV